MRKSIEHVILVSIFCITLISIKLTFGSLQDIQDRLSHGSVPRAELEGYITSYNISLAEGVTTSTLSDSDLVFLVKEHVDACIDGSHDEMVVAWTNDTTYDNQTKASMLGQLGDC